MRDFMVEFWK